MYDQQKAKYLALKLCRFYLKRCMLTLALACLDQKKDDLRRAMNTTSIRKLKIYITFRKLNYVKFD
jgi:hypothetical protein